MIEDDRVINSEKETGVWKIPRRKERKRKGNTKICTATEVTLFSLFQGGQSV